MTMDLPGYALGKKRNIPGGYKLLHVVRPKSAESRERYLTGSNCSAVTRTQASLLAPARIISSFPDKMPVLYRLALATVLAFSLVPQFVAAQSTCEPYDDHWHCPPGVSPPITPPPQPPSATSLCASTTGYVGIATTVTDYDAFTRSLNSVYRTTGAPSLSGTRVPVYTTTRTFPSLGLITAYGYYDSHALSSAGFSFVSGLTVVTTACSPNTPTLPPSPTGSICSPHGDHCKFCPPSMDTICLYWRLTLLRTKYRAL